MKFHTILFLVVLLMCNELKAQQPIQKMKLNAGVITSKLKETKEFYTRTLGFTVKFENEFYLLLQTPNQQDELSFLLPNHPTQNPLFQSAFAGKGVYLTLEVDEVDAVYHRFKELKIPVNVELKTEPWGDRHFAIVDPNGVGIDIVTYTPQSK